jgi:hypothetical protein
LRWFANGHRASVLDPDLAFWANAVDVQGESNLLHNIYRLGQIVQGNVWQISTYDPAAKKHVVVRDVRKDRTAPTRDILPLINQVKELEARYPMLEYLPAYPPSNPRAAPRDPRRRVKEHPETERWLRERRQEARRPIEYVNMVYRSIQKDQATQPIPTLGKKGKL